MEEPQAPASHPGLKHQAAPGPLADGASQSAGPAVALAAAGRWMASGFF